MHDFFGSAHEISNPENHFSSCFDVPSSLVTHEDFVSFDEGPDEEVVSCRSDTDKTNDSIILNLMQFCDVEDIHDTITEIPKPSIGEICVRIEELLYNPSDATETLKQAQKMRFRHKKVNFSALERFLMLYISNHTDTMEDAQENWKHMFWAGHKQKDIVSEFSNISNCNDTEKSRIIADLAKDFAELESQFIDSEFNSDDIEKVTMTQNDLSWWREWVRQSADYEPLSDSNVPVDPPVSNIHELERGYEFLAQNRNWSTPCIARLQGHNALWYITGKTTVIGDGERPLDINLKECEGYEKSESDILAVIELSSDMWFYIENVGEAAFKVNGFVISPGESTYLNHMWLIELNNLALILSVNPVVWQQLVDAMSMD